MSLSYENDDCKIGNGMCFLASILNGPGNSVVGVFLKHKFQIVLQEDVIGISNENGEGRKVAMQNREYVYTSSFWTLLLKNFGKVDFFKRMLVLEKPFMEIMSRKYMKQNFLLLE